MSNPSSASSANLHQCIKAFGELFKTLEPSFPPLLAYTLALLAVGIITLVSFIPLVLMAFMKM